MRVISELSSPFVGCDIDGRTKWLEFAAPYLTCYDSRSSSVFFFSILSPHPFPKPMYLLFFRSWISLPGTRRRRRRRETTTHTYTHNRPAFACTRLLRIVVIFGSEYRLMISYLRPILILLLPLRNEAERHQPMTNEAGNVDSQEASLA